MANFDGAFEKRQRARAERATYGYCIALAVPILPCSKYCLVGLLNSDAFIHTQALRVVISHLLFNRSKKFENLFIYLKGKRV